MSHDGSNKPNGWSRRSKILLAVGIGFLLVFSCYCTFVLTAVTYGADSLVRREAFVRACSGQRDFSRCLDQIEIVRWDRSVFGHRVAISTPEGLRSMQCRLSYFIAGKLRCEIVLAVGGSAAGLSDGLPRDTKTR